MRNKKTNLLQGLCLGVGVYNILWGLIMIFFWRSLSDFLGINYPPYFTHTYLRGLGRVVIGAGFIFPLYEPEHYRGYMWLMGGLFNLFSGIILTYGLKSENLPGLFRGLASFDGVIALGFFTLLLLTRPTDR